MASSSGNSSQMEEDLMDQRKRKRMQSNRESARRSRMRKQKHLDDLTDQISQIKKDNAQILSTITVTTQQFVHIEADNSVLRAQMSELSQRLDYLNEIINLVNNNNNNNNNTIPMSYHCNNSVAGAAGLFEFENNHHDLTNNNYLNDHWSLMFVNQQPIMAAAEMLQY